MKLKKLKILTILSIFVLLSTMFSGCTDPNNSGNLNVVLFTFCSDIRGDGDYDLNVNKTYEPRDYVWIYFEIKDFGSQKISDQNITKIS